MNTHQRSGCWYIDVRPNDSTEQVSLDLTQHLPRRLAVGTSLVVNDDPKRLLPVIRKRWMALLGMIQNQHASTLERTKKDSLQREIERMRTSQFSRQLPGQCPGAEVYILAPQQVPQATIPFKTIYLTQPASRLEFASAVDLLIPGGLVVLYGIWLADYEAIMYDLVRSHTKQKTES